jgi:hypothetical protein
MIPYHGHKVTKSQKFTRMGIPDPSSKAYKQRRGTYFYYNRAAIGLVMVWNTT